MAAISVRLFQKEDIEACARIMSENELWKRYGVTPEAAVKRFSTVDPQKDSVFIAEINGKAAGFCWFVEKGFCNRSGYIQLIGVDPALQHSGAGKAMLSHAESISFAAGREMFLTVSDFNLSAQKFYHRMGYEQVGAIPGFVLPDITELIFRKRIPSS